MTDSPQDQPAAQPRHQRRPTKNSRSAQAGVGLTFGAGLGLIVGLLIWGADGIATAMVFGASIGLVVGAAAEALMKSKTQS